MSRNLEYSKYINYPVTIITEVITKVKYFHLLLIHSCLYVLVDLFHFINKEDQITEFVIKSDFLLTHGLNSIGLHTVQKWCDYSCI